MAGNNTGIIMMGMVLLLGVGGAAYFIMNKGKTERESINEAVGYETDPNYQPYRPGEAGNVYNVGYGGPGGGFVDIGYDYDREWDRDRSRFDHWRSYGGSLVGAFFRDDDIKDFFKWLSKKRRRDDDIEDWIKDRIKKNKKNRRGDRGNRDRDDDDKEWWKKAVDWDRDRDRDRWRGGSPTDRLLDRA